MNQEEFEAIQTLFDKKNKLLDTTELVHSEAYDLTVRELLMKDGKVDYDLLKNSATQKKFKDTLKKHYLKAAKEGLGVTDKQGELEDELLIQAYMGATTETIGAEISSKGHNYTKKAHGELAEKLKAKQNEELTPIVYKDIKTEDIQDVVDYVKASDYIDAKKLRREEAIGLLDVHHTRGLTEKQVEGTHYHKKKAA